MLVEVISLIEVTTMVAEIILLINRRNIPPMRNIIGRCYVIVGSGHLTDVHDRPNVRNYIKHRSNVFTESNEVYAML